MARGASILTLVVIAAALIVVGALYIRLRWWRSPQAYRAMIALAVCYLAAGAILGAWIVHLAAPSPSGYVEAVGRRAGVGGIGAAEAAERFLGKGRWHHGRRHDHGSWPRRSARK